MSPASRATPVTCSPSPAPRSVMTCSRRSVLSRPIVGRSALCAYMRWSASRRASSGVAASAGMRARPCEQPISKAWPVSLSASAASSSELVAPAGRDGGEQAELVAAHPVDAAEALGRRLQALGQADEQRVAGRVAEAVVVLLEAVEVEEREQLRPLVARERTSRVSRSATSARRLPRPVRASVRASSRLAASRRWFSWCEAGGDGARTGRSAVVDAEGHQQQQDDAGRADPGLVLRSDRPALVVAPGGVEHRLDRACAAPRDRGERGRRARRSRPR